MRQSRGSSWINPRPRCRWVPTPVKILDTKPYIWRVAVLSATKTTVNYTLNTEMVGTKEASTGNIRYIHKLSGSKVAMDKFRSDIEAANEADELTNGFIGEKDLLYFYSKEIPSFIKLKRADNGKWFPDESLLKAMDWAASKYPNLTPSMLLALIQGA
jgi:hypothetical protein